MTLRSTRTGGWHVPAHPPINREAMTAFLYRYAGKPAYSASSTNPFRDGKSAFLHRYDQKF